MSKKRVELLNCLKEKAEDIFKELPVKFAVVFGSLVSGKFYFKMSDIDVAVFIEEERFKSKKYDILDIISKIAYYLDYDAIDVVILNDLVKKNPFLLYSIFTEGKLIYCKDLKEYNEFVITNYPYAEDEYYFRLKRYKAQYGKEN